MKEKRNKEKYCHLTQNDRDRIEALLSSGHKQKEIALVLKKNKSTISREVQRNRLKIRARGGNKDGPYEAAKAHHKAYVRRRNSKYYGKTINTNKELEEYIISRLKKHWSPDEISGRMKEDKLPFYASKTAIYDWMYSAWGQRYKKYLYLQRHTKKKNKEIKLKRDLIPNRTGIEMRPEGASNKTRYGHYEGDTIVSGKRHLSKVSLSVIYERKAKYIEVRKIDSLKPKMFVGSVKEMKKGLRKTLSLTLDNGIENRQHEEIGIPIYFCDPYSSWQKGGVENANKMIRRFIPKGSDISNYSDKEIAEIVRILNNKPRKSLDYKTPYEVMIKHGLLTKKVQQKVALGG